MKQGKFRNLLRALVVCTIATSLTLTFSASSNSYIIPVKETAVIPSEYPENTVPTAPTAKPVIIKMGTEEEMAAQNAEYYAHTHAGVYEPAVVNGVSCVKLSYSKPELALMPEYRFMPKFPDNKAITSEHKYVRVTFKTNDTYPAELIICNPGNTNSGYITLMADCSVSNGEWVRSAPVSIEGGGCLNRFLTNAHCAMGFYTTSLNAEYYISEIAFFGSVQQAYEYYGDDYINSSNGCIEMNFIDGSGATYDGELYGEHRINSGTMSLDIMYADKTNIVPEGQTRWCSYLAKIQFGPTTPYSSDYRYMRVLYSAKNPEGVTGASMYVWTDTGYYAVKLVDNIKDTNGEFVLSDTALVGQYAGDRWAGTGKVTSRTHNSLFVNTDKEGGLYSIKSIYFFNTKKAADEFVLGNTKADVTINGTDISNYKVVVSDEAPYHITNAAMSFVKYVEGLTSVTLPIVTDKEPVSEYEILIGVSDREKSKLEYYEDILPFASDSRNVIKVDGKTVIITSELPALIDRTVAKFTRSALYYASTNIPKYIDVCDMTIVVPSVSMGTTKYKNKFYNNTDKAIRFTDDFDTDDGYFTEKNGADVWKIKNGVLTVKADERTVTHMQVFEPNATFSAKMKYRNAGENGDIGLMLRYNADDAWVKAGYDFDKGEWYIENRMGADFYVVRNASSEAEIIPDTEYVLTFTADKYTASLYVNGKKILSANDIEHNSPGMVAFFAEDVTATFDDADVVLLSGEGTILQNVYHTQLDDDTWLAGGMVLEMQDGTLRYHSGRFANLKSTDGGKSWANADIFYQSNVTVTNIMRLNNGSLLMIDLIDGSIVSLISTDDGETWKKIGYVCPGVYNNDLSTNAEASSLADRLFQSPTTDRIFYCPTYGSDATNVNGRRVFCEIYYSDNNGKTWSKSETDPWEIKGNEDAVYFGELKVLECADGSLRLYCSWNQYGCIVYSESTDNGVTWGPLVKMPEFECSHSTMAFARDPNGETDHTYYMVWVYSVDDINANMPRSRLSLAKTTDGKNWVYLGDLWRWESEYEAYNLEVHINHLVNPFMYVTDDAVICGTGASERISFSHHHQQQRQNIWTVMKDTLPEGKKLNVEEEEYPTDHVIIDMTSREAAEKYLEFSTYPTDTEQVQGHYTFDSDKGALSLLHTDQYVISDTEHGTMRYTLKMKAAHLLDGCPYMVVTYKTNIEAELPLRIFNLWKHFKTIAPDVSVSGGEYVRTEPFDISKYEASSGGSNYFYRLNDLGAHILIGVNNKTDPDAYFYIKEIAFFESKEAAEAWYPEMRDDSQTKCGDTDGDGLITLADLANFGRSLAKWTDYALPEDTRVFDLNSDGKVNPLDLVYLARHLSNWDGYEILPLSN